MDAIDAFDLTRGVKFETYCVPRIRGAMLDELRTMDWVPRWWLEGQQVERGPQDAGSEIGRAPFRGRAFRAHWASASANSRR